MIQLGRHGKGAFRSRVGSLCGRSVLGGRLHHVEVDGRRWRHHGFTYFVLRPGRMGVHWRWHPLLDHCSGHCHHESLQEWGLAVARSASPGRLTCLDARDDLRRGRRHSQTGRPTVGIRLPGRRSSYAPAARSDTLLSMSQKAPRYPWRIASTRRLLSL